MLNISNLHNIFWPFLIVWMYVLPPSSQKYLLTCWTHMECFKCGLFRKIKLLNLQKLCICSVSPVFNCKKKLHALSPRIAYCKF